MTAGKNIVLETRNLSVGYVHQRLKSVVLEDLNLTLSAGQLVCFMGPNGIGKSTLIRTLAKLQSPLRGEVCFEEGRALPHNVSVVLTDKVTAGNLSVYELVSFGRYPYMDWSVRMDGLDIKIIDDAIRNVRIDHLKDKRLYELSDGQIQMAMIARALAQDGDIILLDEPTAHLDLNNRLEIMNLLRKLSRNTRKAILVATHELDLALQTADVIWLAGRNKQMLTGIPEDLVLNGSFDEIFQFKGFDLKTGKVQQEAWRNLSVRLSGEGYTYLWTKNALERTGYSIDDEAGIDVKITHDGTISWHVNSHGKSVTFSTLSELLHELDKTSRLSS